MLGDRAHGARILDEQVEAAAVRGWVGGGRWLKMVQRSPQGHHGHLSATHPPPDCCCLYCHPTVGGAAGQILEVGIGDAVVYVILHELQLM